MMIRVKSMLIFMYSVFCYVIAITGQLWFVFYLSDWQLIEKSIHSPQEVNFFVALLTNILLIIIFASQHSFMARNWFKKIITTFIHPASERCTYVLMSGLSLWLIIFLWQPINGTIWHIENDIMSSFISFLFIFGWAFSSLATFNINHFELFGLQQAYLNLVNKLPAQINFTEKLFYKFIRHPIQLGILIGIWATSNMTYGHFTISILLTLYIFLGLYFEEKDLVNTLGDAYKDYKQRVGLVIPKIWR